MCLILFAYRHHPKFRLILAANRDEYYARPTQALQFWHDHPQLAAGRDLSRMGTWLGVTRQGRLAAITNYRQGIARTTAGTSRGHLVTDFLTGDMPAEAYLDTLARQGHEYSGFNLLVSDGQGFYCYSNHGGTPQVKIEPGIHGLSNRLLDTDWPKVRNGKNELGAIIGSQGGGIDRRQLIRLLQDQGRPPDQDLPDTGVGLEWERLLAPIFITSATYGTRSSSIVTIDDEGQVDFTEITWQPAEPQPKMLAQKRETFKLLSNWD